MKSRLESIAVLNRNIRVEGCKFTPTALEFERVDEESLVLASATLQAVGSYGDWWWGDYLVAYAQFRMEADHEEEELREMPDVDKEKLRRHYVRNHGSVVNGKELADTQVERYEVASFYNPRCRHQELSNEHHRLAMMGCDGDIAIAQEWLDRAHHAGWSSNELRAEMRAAKKRAISDPPQRVQSFQHELFGAQRWARAQVSRVPDMDVPEIDAMLADLAPIVALAQSLAAARAARMAGGGKESLSAAA